MTLLHDKSIIQSALDRFLAKGGTWKPLPHQIPPEGSWDVWMLLGGRGSGKTLAGSQFVLQHLQQYGKQARVGVGAPTIADARDVAAEGVTGLINLAPEEFTYNRSIGEARHVSGGYVKFLGSEEAGRWNGPQWSLLWCDELALWNEDSWHAAQFGLRLGEHPRTIITTTPKARQFVRNIADQTSTMVSHATTFDNPNLSQSVMDRLQEQYGESRLGRQELLAEWVDDVEGSLWLRQWIDDNRIAKDDLPDLERIVVAIDPAVSANATSDETGIAVCGIGIDGHLYLLHSEGYRVTPDRWARRAIDLYDEFEADIIIGENNNGGDMVEATIENIVRDENRYSVPFRSIHASRGKVVRAEPVAVLYSRNIVHHVGSFPETEDQMCSFPVANEHDDRVDSITYGFTELVDKGSPDIKFID